MLPRQARKSKIARHTHGHGAREGGQKRAKRTHTKGVKLLTGTHESMNKRKKQASIWYSGTVCGKNIYHWCVDDAAGQEPTGAIKRLPPLQQLLPVHSLELGCHGT